MATLKRQSNVGYHISVLGLKGPDIHIDELIQSLAADSLTAKFKLDPTTEPGK